MPANRPARLAAVPDNLRSLVDSRLAEWDALPAPFQQEFLDNERTLHYFTHVDATNNPALTTTSSADMASAPSRFPAPNCS